MAVDVKIFIRIIFKKKMSLIRNIIAMASMNSTAYAIRSSSNSIICF